MTGNTGQGPQVPGEVLALINEAAPWDVLLRAMGFVQTSGPPYDLIFQRRSDGQRFHLRQDGDDVARLVEVGLTDDEGRTCADFLVDELFAGDRDAAEVAALDAADVPDGLRRLPSQLMLELQQVERARRPDRTQGNPAGPLPPGSASSGPTLVDWFESWDSSPESIPWLCEPLLAAGRSVSLVGPAKSGKSLLALEVCAAIVTGRPVLGSETSAQSRVLYVDFENLLGDVMARLRAMGYGPHDLSELKYVSLAALPPLNTEAGGDRLLGLVDSVKPDLVVLDTLARAVDGDENDSRTISQLYRHTLQPLRERGVTTLRLDHTGRNPGGGARGSSAKNDDVDDVWQLNPRADHLLLERTHSRSGTGIGALVLQRLDAPLHHEMIPDGAAWTERAPSRAEGVDGLLVTLQELEVPQTTGRPKIEKILRERAIRYYKPDLEEAIRRRKRVD